VFVTLVLEVLGLNIYDMSRYELSPPNVFEYPTLKPVNPDIIIR
jgi:hypothetical protein